jgi:hypothetical protein
VAYRLPPPSRRHAHSHLAALCLQTSDRGCASVSPDPPSPHSHPLHPVDRMRSIVCAQGVSQPSRLSLRHPGGVAHVYRARRYVKRWWRNDTCPRAGTVTVRSAGSNTRSQPDAGTAPRPGTAGSGRGLWDRNTRVRSRVREQAGAYVQHATVWGWPCDRQWRAKALRCWRMRG